MGRYFCHEHPDVLSLETRVVDARPGAVVLEHTPFYPGGGGQLADRGTLRWSGGEVAVTGFEPATDGRFWHLLADPAELAGAVETAVEPTFRSMMAQLHTDTHILNALVFQHFAGALVTGAQLNDDGTARMDFDLPEADNDRLARAGAGHQRRHPPGPARPLRLRARGGGARRARAHPQPLGGASAGRRRHDPHRRDRGARPAGAAAGRTWPRPRAPAPCASSRSTTRAATTGASRSAWRAEARRASGDQRVRRAVAPAPATASPPRGVPRTRGSAPRS